MNPHEISRLLEVRKLHRDSGQFDRADEIVSLLKEAGIRVVDHPVSSGLPSSWKPIRKVPKTNILTLVREASDDVEKVGHLSCLIKEQLMQFSDEDGEPFSLEEIPLCDREVQGRMFADIAFSLALCGANDHQLFGLLVKGAVFELRRFGHRSSCRPIDLYQIAERFACSGVLDQSLYSLVAALLQKKRSGKLDVNAETLDALSRGDYSLLSDRALVWLWTYTSHIKKHGRQFMDEQNGSSLEPRIAGNKRRSVLIDCGDTELSAGEALSSGAGVFGAKEGTAGPRRSPLPSFDCLFSDCTLPIVIDIGCGYGVSLLGMGYDQIRCDSTGKINAANSTRRFNFLGCDMSDGAIRYANGISAQWGLGAVCAFVVAEGLECLRWVSDRYSGPVEWILLQFPTPFALGVHPGNTECVLSDDELDSYDSGNHQLPRHLDQFMVTKPLLREAGQLLSGAHLVPGAGAPAIPHTGKLFFQSNVEDVAVYVRKLVESQIFCLVAETTGEHTRGQQLVFEVPDCPQEAYECYNGCTLDASHSSSTRTWALDYDAVRQYGAAAAIPQRQQLWSSIGGERALGLGWLECNPLPHHARTETEVVYKQHKKPVHRILFTCKRGER